MQHLPLEVGEINHIEIDDADCADAREREVKRGRAAEAAGADDEDLRLHQLALTDGADLRHDDVPRVAVHLLRRQHLTARYSGYHRHFVAVADRRVLSLQRMDLLAVDVDVYVAGNLVRLVVDHMLKRWI